LPHTQAKSRTLSSEGTPSQSFSNVIPGLRKLEASAPSHSAVMRAYPEIVTILDYSKGFGHADVLTVSPGGVEMTPARDDDWGFGSVLKPVS